MNFAELLGRFIPVYTGNTLIITYCLLIKIVRCKILPIFCCFFKRLNLMRTRDIILYLSYSYFQFRSFLAVLFLATFPMYRAIFDNKVTCYFSVDDINELLNIDLDFAPCFICSGRCCCHRFDFGQHSHPACLLASN